MLILPEFAILARIAHTTHAQTGTERPGEPDSTHELVLVAWRAPYQQSLGPSKSGGCGNVVVGDRSSYHMLPLHQQQIAEAMCRSQSGGCSKVCLPGSTQVLS